MWINSLSIVVYLDYHRDWTPSLNENASTKRKKKSYDGVQKLQVDGIIKTAEIVP